MLRGEAEMKARIEEEYRTKAEAEVRERIEAEMRAHEEAAAAARSSESPSNRHPMDHNSSSYKGLGITNGGGRGGGGGSGNSHGVAVGTRGLRLTSPGGSSDGTEINSLSARSSDGYGGLKDNNNNSGGGSNNHHQHLGMSGVNNHDGPPFSAGRMLDETEAEEMNAAIQQLYLKTPSGGGGSGAPFVLFKTRLRTSKREWFIERRYSDFVWLHEVSMERKGGRGGGRGGGEGKEEETKKGGVRMC